ncbi:MAG: hypothetical protein MJ246_04215 [Clostridia bacterium]|nr:hypothetical protein [Clostridia bacterium]
MDMLFFSLMPSVISLLMAMFYSFLLLIFASDRDTLLPITIITAILISLVFILVNVFVIISKAIEKDDNNEIKLGMFMIFLSPIIFLVSIPLCIALFFMIRLRKDHREVKVVEEEIFYDGFTSDYLN